MNPLLDYWLLRDVLRPALDIGITAFLIYQIYKILVETRAIQLIKGTILVLGLYGLSYFAQLKTLYWLLSIIAPGLVVGIAIVFQPELRKIFLRLGQGEWLRLNTRSQYIQLDSVLNAMEVLSSRKRGALVVFSRNVGLKNWIDSGNKLNADLSSNLLITIFGHDTPMHDGAVIIEKGRIISAGCFLPLSKQTDIKSSFGTRHRAALGLAEETDAAVLIVSEETGAISLAYNSKIYYDMSVDRLTRILERILKIRKQEEELKS